MVGLDNVLFAIGDLHEARPFHEDRLGLPADALS